MARKIVWDIYREGYGFQYEVTAATRSIAIGIAECRWREETRWQDELFVEKTPMPEFTARKT